MARGWLRVLIAVFVSIMMLEGDALAKRLIPVNSDPTPTNGIFVAVQDESAPLAGALVYIESTDSQFLAQGETDADGHFVADVPEATLAAGVAITAVAGQHAAVSLLENVAHRISIELPRDLSDSFSMISGKLTGFRRLYRRMGRSSRATLGLVAKALDMNDIAQIDSTSLLSPVKDEIDVFGTRQIPSNLVLPDQTFKLYFFPVHVNKPVYRLPVMTGSSSRYFGITGSIDVQEAMNADRWEAINLLSPQKVGLTDVIDVSTGGGTVGLDVLANLPIREVVRLRVGLNTGPADSHRLAFAFWEPIPGVFVPTGARHMQQGDEIADLTAVDRRSAKLLDLLVSEKGDRFRGAWVPASSLALPDAGLTADLVFKSFDSAWLIRGGETAQLMIAHLEEYRKNSVGANRFEDRWVLVGPRKSQLRLPAVAYKALAPLLGKINHVSVDLLQMARTEYPFISGETLPGELAVLEKVRKKIKK